MPFSTSLALHVFLHSMQVDAIASTKMLCQVFRGESVPHSVRCVSRFSEVKTIFETQLTEDITCLFLVNCGAVGCVLVCMLTPSRSLLPHFSLLSPVIQPAQVSSASARWRATCICSGWTSTCALEECA
ncbi:hypothetical protein EON64_19765 [archaeon]|nr:MAG: hypothetical protein EON64_19765 [archaeon]